MASLNGATSNLASPSPRQRNESTFSDNFLIKIVSSVHGAVIARLPPELQMDLSSEWDTALSGGQSSSSRLGIAAAEVLGLSFRNQYSSAQVWSGNSPITLTIPLEFYAEVSSQQEVISPIIKLVKMALPRLSDSDKGSIQSELGLFIPPGPRIFDFNSAANDQITIQFGRFLIFRKVIVTNVAPTIITRDMHFTGLPLKASCEVTFKTIFSLTGNEFENMFL